MAAPFLSIIIPAHNEEAHLPACLRSLAVAAAQAGITPEIIVVLNRCTDGTEGIALSHGCRTVVNADKNLSKIRNAGIRAATGDFIMTIDADSQASPNLITVILAVLNSGRYIGGGTFIRPERWSLGIACTLLLGLPVFVLAGISAGCFYARRETLLEIGGFDEARFAAEDLDLAWRLKRHGRRRGLRFKNIYGAHIITSCRKFDHFGDWFAILQFFRLVHLLRGRHSADVDRLWYDFKH